MSDKWKEPITNFYYIEQLRARGSLYFTWAQDYFLFTKIFPRYLFKDLVIGRPAYDNYLVAMSVRLNVTIVDTTKILTALHQQSSKEPQAVGLHSTDAEHNKKVIGENFDYAKGNTIDAQYETFLTKTQCTLK